MTRYLYLSLVALLTFSCSQNASQTEREYIKNLEEKNKALEKELQEAKGKKPSSEKKKGGSNYFVIGSTEDEVLQVMGDPTSYEDMGRLGKIYFYRSSSVSFKNGRVESYSNIGGNLKVRVK